MRFKIGDIVQVEKRFDYRHNVGEPFIIGIVIAYHDTMQSLPRISVSNALQNRSWSSTTMTEFYITENELVLLNGDLE